MICLLDSGVGGLTVLNEVKRVSPDLRTIYLADNKNFPYGTKSLDEIQDAVFTAQKGLETFCLEKTYIACHTASIALQTQPNSFGLISSVTKKMVLESAASESVAILGSSATITTGYYQNLFKVKGYSRIQGFDLQNLIQMIESGLKDEEIFLEQLKEVALFAPDTILLASTHFPHIESFLSTLFPFAKIMNPSLQFAHEICRDSGLHAKGDLDEDLFVTTRHCPKFLHTLQKNPINNLLKKDARHV
jgi:glutamate racemase